jgi:hypothetical protein
MGVVVGLGVRVAVDVLGTTGVALGVDVAGTGVAVPVGLGV